jgi:hypothetical protein
MAGLCRCCIRSDTHAHQEVIILYRWGCYKFQHLASSYSGDECLHLESLLRSGWIGPLLLTHSCSSSTDIDVTAAASIFLYTRLLSVVNFSPCPEIS